MYNFWLRLYLLPNAAVTWFVLPFLIQEIFISKLAPEIRYRNSGFFVVLLIHSSHRLGYHKISNSYVLLYTINGKTRFQLLAECSEESLQLWQLVTCIPPRRPGFNPRSGYVAFVANSMTLWGVFFRVFPANYRSNYLLYTRSSSCYVVWILAASLNSQLK
jgi:hypothetical protein